MHKDPESWKQTWRAEEATFEEARQLRRSVINSLQRGDKRDRALADRLKGCGRGKRCRSSKCPVCERRRRRRRARRAAEAALTLAGPRLCSQTVVMQRASEIKPEPIRWIWPGVIASGRVTGLAGYPGLGKSQVAMHIAATVSTGRGWPAGTANGDIGDVIILSAEDDPADTVVPRLIAAGAECIRIHVVKAVKDDDGVERIFNLVVDLDRLEKEHDLRRVRLLVIDPISAYLIPTKGGRVNRNDGGDVRTIQGRLARFAARHDLGVLAISHLNKNSGARAITRIMGSQEWAAAPRAVFVVTEEPGTGRRLFLPVKNNLGPDRIGYAFEIENRVLEDGIRTSAVVWSDDPVRISADEALAAAAKKVTLGATDFLEQLLSDGPMDQAEIVRLGKEAGYTEKNLRTAREKLGVKPKKEGFGADGKWVWRSSGDAPALRLVVNNDANDKESKEACLSDKKQPADSLESSSAGRPEGDRPVESENGPDGGDDVA
jgi:putative DNA primase/helicase